MNLDHNQAIGENKTFKMIILERGDFLWGAKHNEKMIFPGL